MNAPFERDTGSAGRCRYWLFAGCALLPILGACGADSKPDSERLVIAKVNGDEITVRELNDRFSRIGLRAGLDANPGGKRQVLDALVDEKLLAQRARESGLDRAPETVSALDRVRHQVLAQAVIDHATGDVRVNRREVRAFYRGNPDLFERRRTYVFRRFDLLGAELPPSVRAELGKAASPAEVGSILKRANVAYSDRTEIHPAEMLAPNALAQVAEMQRGDILIFGETGRMVLLQLVSSIAEPVDLSHAAPAIHAYLADGKRRSAAEILLKDLRQKARIEYSKVLADGVQVQAEALSTGSPDRMPIEKSVARTSALDGASR